MDVWLSSAVVAALIAGVFSTVVSLINSRRLTKLERQRKQFKLEGERLVSVRSAYEQFCNTNSIRKMLSDRRKGDDRSALTAKCDASKDTYVNLMKKVRPDLDSDLYREWNETVKAYDTILILALTPSIGREAPEKQNNDTRRLAGALCNMEDTCEKVLTEQIRRLSESK